MDASFDHHELGLASLKIGLKLDEEGEYPEKVFDYANKSLKILDEIDNGLSLPLEEHGKALKQNQLSQKVLKNWVRTSDLLRAEIDATNMQIALGKFDEAINTLKGVVLLTDKESEERAMIFVSIAKALCNQEKFQEMKRCLQMACGILDKKEKSSPLEVSEAYMEISIQYVTMNEFKTAISLLKRAQAMLEKISEEQHSVGRASARIGWLLLLTGKVQESVSYLEDATERLKKIFGSKHFGV
ncbi:Tetratricopeptide-like helical [Cynara cardunculus var. scolymus]|uniref:Tetratricopeptide-like helical n=1 Tax=Cynara cardunculus var. scolymus TaxID=59895 RepID=A0A103YKH1_CYNCS|nr:Tetratricopeptide-like helical [Cynara cardunculus var. scolymus]